MTFKGLFAAAKKFVVEGIKLIVKNIGKMKTETVLKVGALIGGAGVTVWLYVKTFKDQMKFVKKDKVVKDTLNLVDRGLYNNYSDSRNFDELDECMLNLRKSLSISKNREANKKKKKKLSKSKRERILAIGEKYDPYKERRAAILADLEQFKLDIADKERDEEDEYIYNNYRVVPEGYGEGKNVFEMTDNELEYFLMI